MKKLHFEIDLGKTPGLLEEKLLDFTKENAFVNFKVSLARKSEEEKLITLRIADEGDIKINNGLLIERNYFIAALDRLVYVDFANEKLNHTFS